METYRHPFRDLAKNTRDVLAIHSRKVKPEALLKAFRPNEKPDHLKYRLASYKPVTFGWFNKVLDQFEKIRSAEDWRIAWPEIKANALQEYTQKNYPEHDTFENWLFSYQLKNIIDDPNGLIVFMPRNIGDILANKQLNQSETFKPAAFYFDSSMVIENREAISAVKFSEPDPAKPGVDRDVTMLFDKDEIVKAYYKDNRKTNDQGVQNILVVERYTHRLNVYTVLTCGGLMEKKDADRWLFDSFIAPAIPAWDEAIQGESDHKVDKALHLHPDRYAFAQQRCEAKGCENGVNYQHGPPTPCKVCEGSGWKEIKTPFGEMKIGPVVMGMNNSSLPPMPPAGYILRPIESIKLTKELADAKIFDGLRAINLEMIGEALLNQSGKAKEYDRQEINTYVGKVAKHIVTNILIPGYYFINAWMNPGNVEPSWEKLKPTINVPVKFDLITTEVWMDRVSMYKKDGANPAALAEAEIKLAERQHGTDSPSYKMVRDSIQLDPMYGLTPEQKLEAAMNDGASAVDYIISTKIHYFVRRAAIETSNAFFEMNFGEKVAKLEAYAKETQSAPPITPALPPKIEGVNETS